MKRKRLLALSHLSLALLLIGCVGNTTQPVEESDDQSSEAERPQVTKNVSYRGVVEEAGISIYMEGSHRLVLPDGRILLLQSATMDLDTYIGEDITATGDIRPTVEAGGIIMEVKEVESMEASSSAASEVASSEAMSSKAASSAATSAAATSAPASSAGTSSAGAVSSVAVSSVASSATPSSVAAATSSIGGTSAEVDARAAMMAKDDLGQGNWTQQYCSSHIGFCIPVHKNWWFNSFGTTTSNLWHVEVGPSKIENLGEGPLVVNLVSGSIDSLGVSDKEVRAQGDYVVGHRSWTDNRHFEITAPATLRGAVQHITDNLAEYEVTP